MYHYYNLQHHIFEYDQLLNNEYAHLIGNILIKLNWTKIIVSNFYNPSLKYLVNIIGIRSWQIIWNFYIEEILVSNCNFSIRLRQN